MVIERHEGLFSLNDTETSLLKSQARLAEELRRLPNETVLLLKNRKITRMLQLKEFGGLELHPNIFFDFVMQLASINPSAGWVAGVIGVHPWEACLNDRRLLNELWQSDPDCWIASPYSPMGLLKETQDGFYLNGQWSFSSGTDHCDWVVLGALRADESGYKALQPSEMYHVMLPRSDYEIIEDSWNVVGLQGTGSKDIRVNNVFVPAYRCLLVDDLMNGEAYRKSGLDNPLFRMPWSAIFPNAVSAAVLGMCRGALDSAEDFIKKKVGETESKKIDPYVADALGRANVILQAAIDKLRMNVDRAFSITRQSKDLTIIQRAEHRCEQVNGVWQAVAAMNELYSRCGGPALQLSNPMHRFWRDANVGMNHITFSKATVFRAYSALKVEADPENLVSISGI